jgi:hypothetical protein
MLRSLIGAGLTLTGREGWIGRKGKQQYVEGDSSSVAYTMSSLIFCMPGQKPIVDSFE